MLAEHLADAGYVTAAFTGGGFVSAAFGFGRGFDIYRDDDARLEVFHAPLLRWVRRHRSRPFFLFVHFYNAHRPYVAPPPFGDMFTPEVDPELLRRAQNFCSIAESSGQVPGADLIDFVKSQYDGEIRYADELLRELFAQLDDLDLDERTLIVFLSDHGEESFEHGNCDHIKSLYDPLVKAPLIVAGPGIDAGVINDRTVELRNVGPFVLDYLGLSDELGDASAGGMIGPPTEGPGIALSETCCAAYAIEDGRWKFAGPPRPLWSARSALFKLIAPPAGEPTEFFDLTADPGELENLIASANPEQWADLAGALERLQAAAAAGVALQDLDGATLERLRALGYIR